ncbi:EamA family transporter [Kytococcus sedentarius]|uniref:EamA family transporter n=1 Tax=Kytococcus sedentarius TaxID=1276 RepID=UPI001EF1E9F8|nr:EamA family transporter [Kytococcus sedentarius]
MSPLPRTLLTASAPVAWGTTYWVTTQYLPPGHPLWAGLLRALPAGLLLVALSGHLPRGDWWWRVAVLGTLNIGAFFALPFAAAYRLPGGVAATLGAASPLLVALLAHLLAGERLTVHRLTCGVIGVVGVGLMVLRASASLDAVGVAAGLAGAASMATGSVLTKRWGNPTTPLAFAGWQLTAGGLFLLPLALVAEGTLPILDAGAVAGYLWLALPGAALAYPVWFRGIGTLPVGSVAFLALLSPAVAALIGVGLAGEHLTGPQWAGFTLALDAVAAAQVPPHRWPMRSAASSREHTVRMHPAQKKN